MSFKKFEGIDHTEFGPRAVFKPTVVISAVLEAASGNKATHTDYLTMQCVEDEIAHLRGVAATSHPQDVAEVRAQLAEFTQAKTDLTNAMAAEMAPAVTPSYKRMQVRI